jgi:hypothetical protein
LPCRWRVSCPLCSSPVVVSPVVVQGLSAGRANIALFGINARGRPRRDPRAAAQPRP